MSDNEKWLLYGLGALVIYEMFKGANTGQGAGGILAGNTTASGNNILGSLTSLFGGGGGSQSQTSTDWLTGNQYPIQTYNYPGRGGVSLYDPGQNVNNPTAQQIMFPGS